MKNEVIPVVFCSDDKFAAYLSVAIRSLASSSNNEIVAYVLDFEITKDNKEKLIEDNSDLKNIKIEFIKVDNALFEDFPEKNGITKSTYGRYLAPKLLSKYKKIIFSDIDVAFVKDIEILYKEDLDGFAIGAVPEQKSRIWNNYSRIKKRLGLSESHDLFMAGLLLIDTEKWNKNQYTERLLNKTIEIKDRVLLLDQDVLNVVFENNYKKLSAKYCVIYKIFDLCYTIDERRTLIEDGVIVHYPGAGSSKPWNNRNLISSDFWWKNAEQSLYFKNKNVGKVKKGDNLDLENIKKEVETLKETVNKQSSYIKFLNKILQIYINPFTPYFNDNKVAKLHRCEILVLSLFSKIAKKHGIKYWLDFETLMGSVNSGSLLPWSNEIDIGVLREDYNLIGTSLYKEFENIGLSVSFGSGEQAKIIQLSYQDSSILINILPYDLLGEKLTQQNRSLFINRLISCAEKFKQHCASRKQSYCNSIQSDYVINIQNAFILNNNQAMAVLDQLVL